MPRTNAATDAGSVYTNETEKSGRTAARKGGAKVRPQKPSGNAAGEQMFRSTLRTMILVFLGMGAMLAAAYVLSDKLWHLKHQRHILDAEAMSHLHEEFDTVGASSDRGDDEAATSPKPESSFPIEKVKKAAYWANLARSEMIEQSFDDALKHFQLSLEIWPHQPKVWLELGHLYLDLKQLGKAKLALQRAAESDPSNLMVLTGLGEIYLRESNIDLAESMLTTAEEIDPRYERTYFLLGMLEVTKGNDADAMSYLKKYLGFEPNDAKALLEKAGIEARRGDFTSSLESIKRAIVADPESGDLYFQAAAASALMNRIDDAVRYLEKGEAFSDPQAAYRVFQSPAFDLIRRSDIGQLYEEELAERVRRLLRELQEEQRN